MESPSHADLTFLIRNLSEESCRTRFHRGPKKYHTAEPETSKSGGNKVQSLSFKYFQITFMIFIMFIRRAASTTLMTKI